MKLLVALLDLLGASASAGGRLVIQILLGIITCGVVILGYVVFGMYFGLVSPGFFVGASAAGLLILSIWLSSKGIWAAKPFVVVSVLTLISVAWPGLGHFMSSSKQTVNSWFQERGDLIVTPKVVPCDKPFFIGEDSHPRYWHVAGSPECLDRKGKHPDTHQVLVAVMPDDVYDILKAKATVAPPPAPTHDVVVASKKAAETAVPISIVTATAPPPAAIVERTPEAPKERCAADNKIEIFMGAAKTDLTKKYIFQVHLQSPLYDENNQLLVERAAPVVLTINRLQQNFNGYADLDMEVTSIGDATIHSRVRPVKLWPDKRGGKEYSLMALVTLPMIKPICLPTEATVTASLR